MSGPFATEASQISNGTFDTRAALVPGPFGPLTRVGDMPDVTPNSNIPIEVTSASPYSLSFFISYDDMNYGTYPLQVIERLVNEHGIDGFMYYFESWKEILDANITAITNFPKVTDAEFASIMNFLRVLEQLFALVPRYRADNFNHEEVLDFPDFTAADATGNAADISAISISGDYDWVAWTSPQAVTTWTPSNVSAALTQVVFGSAGAKSITLHVAGPGGIQRVTKSVTVTT